MNEHLTLGEWVTSLILIFGFALLVYLWCFTDVIKDLLGKGIIGYKPAEKPMERALRLARLKEEDEKRNRPSSFTSVRISPTAKRYSSPDITVTATTNLATGEVSFEWEFLTDTVPRRVALTYTSSLAVLKDHNKSAEDEIGDAETTTDARHGFIPFAPESTLPKHHESNVLPEGTWYVRFQYIAGDHEDKFDYTVLLEQAVRRAAPVKIDLSVEQQIEALKAKLPQIVQGAEGFDQLTAVVKADASLSPQQMRLAEGAIQRQREAFLRNILEK